MKNKSRNKLTDTRLEIQKQIHKTTQMDFDYSIKSRAIKNKILNQDVFRGNFGESYTTDWTPLEIIEDYSWFGSATSNNGCMGLWEIDLGNMSDKLLSCINVKPLCDFNELISNSSDDTNNKDGHSLWTDNFSIGFHITGEGENRNVKLIAGFMKRYGEQNGNKVKLVIAFDPIPLVYKPLDVADNSGTWRNSSEHSGDNIKIIGNCTLRDYMWDAEPPRYYY